MIQFVWMIPVLMALIALINGVGCRKLGKVAGYLATGGMFVCFLMSAAIFFEAKHIAHEATEAHKGIKNVAERLDAINEDLVAKGTVHLFTWFEIPASGMLGRDLKVDFAFYVDPLSSIFLLFISFIGTLIFLYATAYMMEKPHAHHGDHGHGHGHDDHGHGHGHGHDHGHDAHGHHGDHFGHGPMYHEPEAKTDAHGYAPDPGYARFFAYLALFAASMFTLILGATLPVMFIGWEGVGLCSYLLIGYYFNRPFSDTLSCADAGRKAFVVNRIGDFGLILGFFLLFWGLGTLNIQEIVAILSSGRFADGSPVPMSFMYNGGLITAATLLMFLGATGKSAQIPLFVWLPDAMAGPTPVSALIHAATMVTAGVYMLARLNVLYMYAPTTLATVAVVGGLTAFVAAFAGLTQRGIKKALAYSTVSQLGYMFLAMGVGAFAAGIFHVFTHAFFKGCLFLCAGSVIHALHHEEDMYKMGGLKKKMPITAMTYFIATLCIAGIPLTSGFFSKDEILYMTYLSSGDHGISGLYVLGVLTALMTAIYMGRTYYLTFEGKSRVAPEVEAEVHESPYAMTVPLMLLSGVALLVGFVNVPKGLIPLGEYNAMFHHYLEPVTDRGAAVLADKVPGYAEIAGKIPYGAEVVAGHIHASHGSLELILAVVSSIIAVVGLFVIARTMYTDGVEKEAALARRLGPVFQLSLNRWWWDDLYNYFIKDGTMIFSRGVWRFDMGVVDGAVNGVGHFCRKVANDLRRLQSGQVQIYGLVMFLGVVSFILYFALGLATFLEKTRPTPPTARSQPLQVNAAPEAAESLATAAVRTAPTATAN